MRISLTRTSQNSLYSIGILALQQRPWFVCDTLEPGTAHPYPCIPDGTYTIKLMHSERFERQMPFLIDVPGREAIEIHIGNMPKDTHGCILVGVKCRPPQFLEQSKVTFDKLFELLAESPLPIQITVTTVPSQPAKVI